MEQKYRINAIYRQALKKKIGLKLLLKYRTDPMYQELRKSQIRVQKRQKYVNDAKFRLKCSNITRKRTVRSTEVKSNITTATNMFREHIQHGPVITCICCHRHMYKQNVVAYTSHRYPKCDASLLANIEAVFGQVPGGKHFICKTCHSHLLRGQLPAQAALQ